MLYQLSYFRIYNREGNEIGKVMLYQLSYFRIYNREGNETRTHTT